MNSLRANFANLHVAEHYQAVLVMELKTDGSGQRPPRLAGKLRSCLPVDSGADRTGSGFHFESIPIIIYLQTRLCFVEKINAA